MPSEVIAELSEVRFVPVNDKPAMIFTDGGHPFQLREINEKQVELSFTGKQQIFVPANLSETPRLNYDSVCFSDEFLLRLGDLELALGNM